MGVKCDWPALIRARFIYQCLTFRRRLETYLTSESGLAAGAPPALPHGPRLPYVRPLCSSTAAYVHF